MLILDPTVLAKTLLRDLGAAKALRYAEMIGRSGTELGRAYAEAATLLAGVQPCRTCGIYPQASASGICEGCAAYAEHQAI